MGYINITCSNNHTRKALLIENISLSSLHHVFICHRKQLLGKNITCIMLIPDSKVHGATMGPIWGRQDPGGPHAGPMRFAIWDDSCFVFYHEFVQLMYTHIIWSCLTSTRHACDNISNIPLSRTNEITTIKQGTASPCVYFMWYTIWRKHHVLLIWKR